MRRESRVTAPALKVAAEELLDRDALCRERGSSLDPKWSTKQLTALGSAQRQDSRSRNGVRNSGVRSCPFRLISFSPPRPSRTATIRWPSNLTSCSQLSPSGGRADDEAMARRIVVGNADGVAPDGKVRFCMGDGASDRQNARQIQGQSRCYFRVRRRLAFRYSKNRRYAGINRASRSLYSIWQMLNTWLTNDDEALQRVWGLVSIDGVAEEWTA